MTPEERARAVFDSLSRKGIQPFDEIGWMNRDDIEAITEPIADAIREAVAKERQKLANFIRANNFEWGQDFPFHCCPACGGFEDQGHYATCEFAEALGVPTMEKP